MNGRGNLLADVMDAKQTRKRCRLMSGRKAHAENLSLISLRRMQKDVGTVLVCRTEDVSSFWVNYSYHQQDFPNLFDIISVMDKYGSQVSISTSSAKSLDMAPNFEFPALCSANDMLKIFSNFQADIRSCFLSQSRRLARLPFDFQKISVSAVVRLLKSAVSEWFCVCTNWNQRYSELLRVLPTQEK